MSEYIKIEDALKSAYSLWNGSEFVDVVNMDYLKSLPTYSFPEEPKNGERFSCPNCGFKADFYLPERKDDCMKAVRRDCGLYG